MASVGHSSLHAPQAMQSSLILYANCEPSFQGIIPALFYTMHHHYTTSNPRLSESSRVGRFPFSMKSRLQAVSREDSLRTVRGSCVPFDAAKAFAELC
jgi:hypothetical protein